MSELPLFPLSTVLFPGGPLSLRIFETRYVDLVRRCLKEDSAFGVVLIRSGAEVGEVAVLAECGTTARLIDFETRTDGLLGVRCLGGERFRLLERHQQADGLHLGSVQALPGDPAQPLPEEFAHLGALLRELLPRVGEYARIDTHYEDAGWVANRWAEILPIAMEERQELLELTNPVARITRVADWAARQPASSAS
jgi:uncharacterized protein